MIRSSLAALAGHNEISTVQPVIHGDDAALFQAATAGIDLLPPVQGGASRQASVRAGLRALESHHPDLVLVHDAARPFASDALITRAIAAAGTSGAAVPVIAVADTVKTVDATGCVTGTIDRAQLRMVQTPQAFGFAVLLDAHQRAAAAGRDDFTDDAALAEWAGLKVTTFKGEAGNVKLTTDDDFSRAEVAKLAALSDVRTGFGFDVHQFGDGDHVMLGGVRIPHGRGLSGHSDADVVLHALVDAILGALSEGDIGVHFPPTDARWRGASSDRFFAFAVERVHARGGRIAHIDVTIVCEAPRIGPHRDQMRTRIAELAGIPIERVGVKATTSEKMGFTGRGEGMAAFANATVRLPWSD
jgi:2-C-methyl-D-erythritol 4-phosphate cytidylyltransferase/2-C-methyl-D-erythritol 2,4-cyclodiphosphate synthase